MLRYGMLAFAVLFLFCFGLFFVLCFFCFVFIFFFQNSNMSLQSYLNMQRQIVKSFICFALRENYRFLFFYFLIFFLLLFFQSSHSVQIVTRDVQLTHEISHFRFLVSMKKYFKNLSGIQMLFNIFQYDILIVESCIPINVVSYGQSLTSPTMYLSDTPLVRHALNTTIWFQFLTEACFFYRTTAR